MESSEFIDFVASLDQTVFHYNKLKSNTKPVEYKLIEEEIKEIDAQLERAEHALNWNSEGTPVLVGHDIDYNICFILGIWNYMENLRCVVMDLGLRVSKAQENVETIKHQMQHWKDSPLFIRADDGRSEGLLNLKGTVAHDVSQL